MPFILVFLAWPCIYGARWRRDHFLLRYDRSDSTKLLIGSFSGGVIFAVAVVSGLKHIPNGWLQLSVLVLMPCCSDKPECVRFVLSHM